MKLWRMLTSVPPRDYDIASEDVVIAEIEKWIRDGHRYPGEPHWLAPAVLIILKKLKAQPR